LRPTQCERCVTADVLCEPGTTEATCKRCQTMRKACRARGRGYTISLPPNKILRMVAPKVQRQAAAKSPQKRGVRVARAQASPEVEEVGRPGPSRAVYLNEPPADWESDEMAAAVARAGRAWKELGKAKALEARAAQKVGEAKALEARANEEIGEAMEAIAAALNKQNA
jgi:hypothetical protein